MNRRRVMTGLGAGTLAVGLAGCGGQSVTRRFRVIATAEVDGKIVEGSTVMQITYSRVEKSLVGAGGSTNLKGEALILDLPGKGTVYVLPWVHVVPGGTIDQVYEYGVLTTLAIAGGIGAMRDEGFEKLRDAQGRMPFRRPSRTRQNGLPLFVAFTDEKAPKTIFEVDPFSMGAHFPGVKLLSFDIEFTDARVTSVLTKRLPWLLDTPQSPKRWERTHFYWDPPGQLRGMSDQPLTYKIREHNFFALGGN